MVCSRSFRNAMLGRATILPHAELLIYAKLAVMYITDCDLDIDTWNAI
jgi:hypothetical protein